MFNRNSTVSSFSETRIFISLTAENCQFRSNVLAGKLFENGIILEIYPLYTGRKVILRKMFRSHPSCLLNVFYVQFTPCQGRLRIFTCKSFKSLCFHNDNCPEVWRVGELSISREIYDGVFLGS